MLGVAVHLDAGYAVVGVYVDGGREGCGFAALQEGDVVHEAEVVEGDGGEGGGGVGFEIGVGGGRVWEFSDEGELGPVEVDFAEPAAFGDKGGDGGGWLVEDVGGAGGERVGEGVGGGKLEVGGGFDDDVPAEGGDGVGAGGGAEDLCTVEVGVGG